jgi:hypothetical protein
MNLCSSKTSMLGVMREVYLAGLLVPEVYMAKYDFVRLFLHIFKTSDGSHLG